MTHPLGVDEHLDLEENDVIDGNVFISIQNLKGLAHRHAVHHRRREHQRRLCVRRNE